jgi:hypothetical protein
MFVKIDQEAIINVGEIVSITKNYGNESLDIRLRGIEEPITIYGKGTTKTDKRADTDRTYNFLWDSICDWRSTQPHFDGIKIYAK